MRERRESWWKEAGLSNSAGPIGGSGRPMRARLLAALLPRAVFSVRRAGGGEFLCPDCRDSLPRLTTGGLLPRLRRADAFGDGLRRLPEEAAAVRRHPGRVPLRVPDRPPCAVAEVRPPYRQRRLSRPDPSRNAAATSARPDPAGSAGPAAARRAGIQPGPGNRAAARPPSGLAARNAPRAAPHRHPLPRPACRGRSARKTSATHSNATST
jgi:hypothetical protein